MFDELRRWSLRDAPVRAAFAVAAVLGFACYLVVFGPAHLVGTSPYWEMPSQDERVYLMGYRYFLAEPWGWPLFDNELVNVPFTTSITFWDPIPIWALLNKLVATLLPWWEERSIYAYLGLWHASTYVLQACFGVAIARVLGHRSWRATFVMTLFVLAVPAWIYRQWHDSLSAHWLELWALYLYLRTLHDGRVDRRLAAGWAGVLAIGSMVTPYHPVICSGILFAALAGTRRIVDVIVGLVGAAAIVVSFTWLAGYLSGEAKPQWGFEAESTNLLSWLVPVRSGIIGDGRWIANVMGTDWQYEGYAYFGMGYLALLVAAALHVRTLGPVIRRHAWLLVVATGFGVLALSTHVYFGSHEVFVYRLPGFLRFIKDHFRAPGRFVWVPMYVVMLYVLHVSLQRYLRGPRAIFLALALVVQLVDASGDWREHAKTVHGPQWWRVFDLGPWRQLVSAHAGVRIHPTYTCITADDQLARRSEVSLHVQLLASEYALPINGTYNARVVRDCAEEERAWPTLAPEPNVLYVLLPQAMAIADRFGAAGLACAGFDDGRVCSTNRAAIERGVAAAILRPLPK